MIYKKSGGYMTNTAAKPATEPKLKFTPNMENFKVSLSYEGLSIKKSNEGKSITELKRQYAR